MIRIILFLLLIGLPAYAVTNPDEKLNDPALEARAYAITSTLRCVVCQNESIEESRADMAHDLRKLVRDMVKDGKTNAQIMAFLRGRYGDFIFLKPPVMPRTYILWGMPVLVLLAGGAMILATSARRRRRMR